MLASLFKTKPAIDENTQQWIIDTFVWAMENFGDKVFSQQTELILPTNDYYPGKVSSVHEMALAIFNNTVDYAHMSSWPLMLVAPQIYQPTVMPKIPYSGDIRGQGCAVVKSDEQIKLTYNPTQINQPQDLIATFAQNLAQLLILQKGVLPPGGQENIPQAADLLACFMGFGIMLANTAYQFKGGCGSCFNANANRQAALPEQDTLYILAMFCVLKSVPTKTVLPHLKSHMKSTFKASYKEANQLLKNTSIKSLRLS